MSNEPVRLQKFLADSGVCSRRAAEALIFQQEVWVNGKAATPGQKITPGVDKVTVSGKTVRAAPQALITLAVHKPRGLVCSNDDPHNPETIFSLLPRELAKYRFFCAGRLDKDSTGLILLTSDGRVNNALLAPKAVKEKVYVVETNRPATEEQLSQLAAGVVITTTSQRQGKTKAQATLTAKTRPCGIKRLPAGNPQSRKIEFTLTEGRNRQIRKMVDTLGLRVVSLHRVSFCGVTLKGLAEGNWAELSESEMAVVNRALDKAGGGTGDKPMKVFDYPEE